MKHLSRLQLGHDVRILMGDHSIEAKGVASLASRSFSKIMLERIAEDRCVNGGEE